ncbi:pro-sigmaK processing inhibitor BofA family protein [Candidatus Micrarchaeota archaeon]|nr:pro-sigmaK processing inhibitor BofA family protein [Candidatus Micrarchaeota archaeon]
MAEIVLGVGLVGLLLALFIVYLIYRFLKNPLYIIANSVVGILIFLVLNFFLGLSIPINIFSVGIVAIGGVPGVLLVLLIHFLGLGF